MKKKLFILTLLTALTFSAFLIANTDAARTFSGYFRKSDNII